MLEKYPVGEYTKYGDIMKKFIPLRIQNILKYIPFLNCLILFFWLYNYSLTEKNPKVFMKSLMIIFGVSIPIVILQILISKIIAEYFLVLTILNYLTTYVIPFIVGYALIKYQKRVLEF